VGIILPVPDRSIPSNGTTLHAEIRTNFAHLQAHDDQLVRLGMLAERYFADDPNTALLKLRQLAELLAQYRHRDGGGLARSGRGCW
jgi:hypothetical protein